jgi:hypothetical protein
MADKCKFMEDFVALIDSQILNRALKGDFRCCWGCQRYLSPLLTECLQKHYTARGFYVEKSFDMYVAWIRPTVPIGIYSGLDAEKVRAIALGADVAPQLKCQEFCLVLHDIHDIKAFRHEYRALSSHHAEQTPTICDLELRDDEIPIFTGAVIQELMQTRFGEFMTASLVEPKTLRLEFVHIQRCGN